MPGRQAGTGQHRRPDRAGPAWLARSRLVSLAARAGRQPAGGSSRPGFFLSLTGALTSLVARWRWRLASAGALVRPVSQSILAAFAHVGGQVLLARAWLVPHDGVFYLVPVFACSRSYSAS